MSDCGLVQSASSTGGTAVAGVVAMCEERTRRRGSREANVLYVSIMFPRGKGAYHTVVR